MKQETEGCTEGCKGAMVKGAVSVGILSNYGLRARFTVDLYDIIKLWKISMN